MAGLETGVGDLRFHSAILTSFLLHAWVFTDLHFQSGSHVSQFFLGHHNFPVANQHNKKICKFVIKPGTSPMFLHHKGDKNKQIFYRRNHNAPKTEELNLKEGWTYIRDRFPDYKLG